MGPNSLPLVVYNRLCVGIQKEGDGREGGREEGIGADVECKE